MNLTAGRLVSALLLSMLAITPAVGQLVSDEIPHGSYYLAVQAFYSGEYRDAERALRRETQRGVRTVQARWIDSICYHAMLGEVLYQQGRNAEALAEFDQACQLLLAYPNWLLQVKFQQPPRPDANRARRAPPWGRSERQFTLGLFPPTEQVLIGDLDANRAFQEGGVVRAPMLWRVNVAEIVRTSALAIRRRNELLGPLAEHDRISKDLSETFARGNLAPPNHWSSAWIDLLRGLTLSGIGRRNEAEVLIGRAVVVNGQFDHPLSCVALLEQGRLAIVRGDHRGAARLLAEAGYSAYYYEDWDVLTESMRLGWLNHLASGGAGVYPPLEPVAAWAQVNRLDHLAAKLRLAHAESLAWLGQIDAAAALVADTARRLGEMRTGLAGIHVLYVDASLQVLRGQVGPGMEALARAVAAQAGASPRIFRILRTNEMFDAGEFSPRIVVDLYGQLLADPTPGDWVYEPLDSMAVLKTAQEAALDRWFLAALGRKDFSLALEIAERAKRRRYLSSLVLGGRLAALRTILEAPTGELSREALLERQQILARFPAYRALAESGQVLYDELRAGPLIAGGAANAQARSARFELWAKNARQRERLLAQLAPRRLAAAIEFPPLASGPELQQSLGEGEALIVFHAAAGDLYGLLLTQTDVHAWRLDDLRRLRRGIGDLLRELGNYGPNRPLSVEELASEDWQKLATAAYEAVFADARLDLDKTKAMIVVPDDVLWYLPFEVLLPNAAPAADVLGDRMPIRYGPTAALAVSKPRPLRRPQHTAIVASEATSGNTPVVTEEMLDGLEKVVAGPLRLPTPLPQPADLVAPLIDLLIALDEVELQGGSVPSVLPRYRGSAAAEMGPGLPYGGPERIVLTGLATAAEQGLRGSRRAGGRSARAGDELFFSLCGLMSDGARTVLLTRWRTGGRTNFELVREFVRELPHTLPTEAWQRACLLARESPLDAAREPRLKRLEHAAELPKADHPFFWAAYLLVDTEPRKPLETIAGGEERKEATAEEPRQQPSRGDQLPPPTGKPAEAANQVPDEMNADGRPGIPDGTP